MKKIYALLIAGILIFLSANTISAEELLTEETVKNFTYHLLYSDKTVTLKNGEYESPLIPGNQEDMENFIHVKLIKYLIIKSSSTNNSSAIVILAENEGGSGFFFQITALVQEKGEIIQTNSIELGDRVEIKDLKFVKGFDEMPFRRSRDKILLALLTHKETDPTCCPSKLENKCFTLVRDKENKIQLLTCEQAEEEYPLPVVKKPAIYLYPEKTEKVEITLNPEGNITKTIPHYNGKWSVTVNPDGIIDGKYQYLFYEVELSKPVVPPDEGWVVYRKDLSSWFDKYLSKLGLNSREIKDFKEYWMAELQKHPDDYYEIKLLTDDFLSKNLQVKIEPEPDTFIRVILHFKPIFGNPKTLKEPAIKTPERRGFTAVEWGGIMEESDKSDIKNPEYSFLPTETGIIILRALEIKDHKIKIKVNTGGCTDKRTIKPVLRESETTISNQKGAPKSYEIIFIRTEPDRCKALFPEGTDIEYDISKEFNIKMPYTITVKNPTMPITKNDPYFIFGKVKSEVKEVPVQGEEGKFIGGAILEMITEIRRDVKNATLYAINQEIKRYKQRKDSEKVKKLEEELEKIKNMADESFPVPEEDKPLSDQKDILQDIGKFGTIVPCKPVKVEMIFDRKYSTGEILNIKGMTKSGPFYHIAGIRKGIFDSLKPGNIYETIICLVYKREYFGFIPDYYVYVADVKK
ncbi:hypothetical protein [Thermodesulfovibrio sp. 3462-1]|uniref:Uncharacterized protein n=1 Tax=Thermodesulfovibrio obliviosus TaxID=3118332 RepID=A0AAU8H109_9BACT